MGMDKRLRDMDNRLKTKFNEVAAVYDQMRPVYVPELFDEVIRYAEIDDRKYALEVGIGTGQATLPFLQTGCGVTAIEIGPDLARFVQKKYAGFPNFRVINQDFESVEIADNTYDCFYCASAFHWIPKQIGYAKAFRVLKSGGVLALFFNRPYPASDTDPAYAAIQKVYDKYMPGASKPQAFDERDCVEIIRTVEQYGFADAHYKLYQNTRTFCAEDYVALLSTYSDHRAMGERRWEAFGREVVGAINSQGGTFTLRDTIDLYLARKP